MVGCRDRRADVRDGPRAGPRAARSGAGHSQRGAARAPQQQPPHAGHEVRHGAAEVASDRPRGNANTAHRATYPRLGAQRGAVVCPAGRGAGAPAAAQGRHRKHRPAAVGCPPAHDPRECAAANTRAVEVVVGRVAHAQHPLPVRPSTGLRRGTQAVLEGMMGAVALPSVLHKLVKAGISRPGAKRTVAAWSDASARSAGSGRATQDQGTAPFGDYKEIILAILDTYNYEDVLLTTTAHILAGDLYQSTLQQGTRLPPGRWCLCQRCRKLTARSRSRRIAFLAQCGSVGAATRPRVIAAASARCPSAPDRYARWWRRATQWVGATAYTRWARHTVCRTRCRCARRTARPCSTAGTCTTRPASAWTSRAPRRTACAA